ncbi:hypothetical protein F2Q69_00030247 [Brassica cretica]|uniref:Uncharacterized protein n=1 Tax=Brassica cretica TaxID=69181 RepID=A0A8S9RTB4_BRACR|nr:hypothetical protein F2Q69_00030247 [Brassica cretica]
MFCSGAAKPSIDDKGLLSIDGRIADSFFGWQKRSDPCMAKSAAKSSFETLRILPSIPRARPTESLKNTKFIRN